jgi:hypothetical protein
MAQENRATIKTYFETGDVPTESQFANSFDSQVFWVDDVVTSVDNTSTDAEVPTAKAVFDLQTFTKDANNNVFYNGVTATLDGTNNIFLQGAVSNVFGTTTRFNIIEQFCSGFTFGDGLEYTTIKSGSVGEDYTASPDFDFLYGNDYPSEIFRNAENTANYHRYYDPTNNRIVLTNLTTLAVSHLGETVFVKDANDNIFYDGMESQVTLGTSCSKNIFHKTGGAITLGNGAIGNIFEPTENITNFVFGANLRNVTIKAGNYPANPSAGTLTLTASGYNFMYSKDYPSEIFMGSDNVPYHKYYDGANDRYVITNLLNFDVAYIGGASGGSGIPKLTASGTDTYTATISGVASYTDGDTYLIRFTNGNTTGATLNINSLGAKTLYRNNDGAIIGGDFWDGGEMLCVYNSTLNGFQCIGTSPNSIFAYVTNADSVTITKGQVVYAFGGTGDRMTVKLANNSTDATSARTVGVVFSASIGANQKGIIILQGLIDGLSILGSPFVDGDSVYLGSTNGSITRTKQYAPNHLVYIGTVTTASAGSAGRMYVKIQNGYEMDELHNVSAQTPANKDGLFYNTTTSLWESRQVAATDIDANVSNTEFGYLDGVTSAIQSQIDTARRGTIFFAPSSINPLDSTTYYFSSALGIGTTAGSFDVNLGYAFRVIGATIQAFNNSGTVGSSEDSTLQLRNVTQGTSSSIGTFKTNAAALAQTEVTYTGLNISVAATDFFALQWDFPAAGTNPTNVFMRVNLLIQFT